MAVQRHRIYPPGSQLCLEAVSKCRSAMAELFEPDDDGEDEDPAAQDRPDLLVGVGPTRLYIELDALPATGPIAELAERLFRADVEEILIRPDATETDIRRFCRNVAGWDRRRDRHLRLSEILTELDASGIRVRDAERLEVLDFEIVTSNQLEGLHAERRQRVRDPERRVESSLHRAWARADVDAAVEPIDMVDLTYLVDDHTDLARMLHRLAEGSDAEAHGSAALRGTVLQLVNVYSRLDSETAEIRFRELAASLMELEPEARRTLTRDLILPDVLETGKSVPLMRMLPDAHIAEAISDLADLEIGGQGLVRLALRRLELSPERLEVVLRPLLATTRGEIGSDADSRTEIRLSPDGDVGRDMREFAAHELSVDAETRKRLEALREELSSIDGDAERLRCAAALVPHLRNPERAAAILRPLPARLSALMGSEPEEAAEQIRALSETATRLEDLDPELADTVRVVLREVMTPEVLAGYALDWVEEEGAGEDRATSLLAVFGPVVAEAFVRLLESEERRPVRRAVMEYVCHHAGLFAPILEPWASDPRWTVVRNVVRVLGFGGSGYEPTLARALGHPEKRVVRETLLALSRIGSARAAEEIFAQLAAEDDRRELAEDAIGRFPHAEGVRLTERLLSKPEFYRDRPYVARMLIARFLVEGGSGSRAHLEPLLPLRFRFWEPALMRLGWTAARALRRSGR